MIVLNNWLQKKDLDHYGKDFQFVYFEHSMLMLLDFIHMKHQNL